MTRQLFVYWKTARGQADRATAAVAAQQHAWRQRYAGLMTRLYRRADEPGESVTLMETYARPGGVDAALQAEIAAAGDRAVAAWCQGRRHVEVFDELRGGDPGRTPPP